MLSSTKPFQMESLNSCKDTLNPGKEKNLHKGLTISAEEEARNQRKAHRNLIDLDYSQNVSGRSLTT